MPFGRSLRKRRGARSGLWFPECLWHSGALNYGWAIEQWKESKYLLIVGDPESSSG